MSDQESDEDFDDLSWNLELQNIYADDSWSIENVKIDEEADDIAWKNTLSMKMLDYPEMLLRLYQDEEPAASHDSKYPKKSVLSRSEMERYVRLQKTFRKVQSISEVEKKNFKNFKDWKSLQSKVLAEQEEYQRFLMDLSPTFILKYNHVDPAAENWFQSQMKIAAGRVRKYKQLYVHFKDFGIVFVPFKNDTSPCPITNLVKHLGNIKPIFRVAAKTKIPDSLNNQTSAPSNPIYTTRCWKKCVVSEDVNAERLAIAWNADIVIGMSALKTLADNLPPYKAEWEIPVLVRTFGGLAFSKKHKIAFIDKPLPPRCIAPREKNQIYFKEMFKRLSHVKKEEAKHNFKKKSKTEENENSSSDNAIAQLDGANDDFCDNFCQTVTTTGLSNQKNPFEKHADHVSDYILQVDGANDDSKDGKTTRALWNRKTKVATPSNNSAWLNLRKPSGMRNLRTPSSDSGDSEPFGAKRSTRSWAQTRESKPVSSVLSHETDEAKFPQLSNSAETSAELSFSLLPETALSLPVNSLKNKSKSSENPANNDIADVGFTPRRSTRTKTIKSNSTPLKISLDGLVTPKNKNTNSSQMNLRGRTGKKVVAQLPEESSSDDEPLIVTKRKNQQKMILAQVKLEHCKTPSKDRPKDEGQCSKSTSRNNTISENDVLGQILGAKPRAAPTMKDISSTWARQAERMEKTDVDNSYSTNDLVLLQPDRNDNVTYTLWKFGKKRVLIRYTIDGSLAPPNVPNTEKRFSDSIYRNLSDVSLKSKLEYQSDYVFESLTQSELCRDYVTMLFKRPSKIVKARIEPLKKEILDVEWTLSMSHFQDKAEKVGYNSAVTSKLLMKLFEMIGDLEKGEYICTHRENELKLSVRKSVDVAGKNVVYDLHKEYSNPGRSVVYTNIAPWLPGDPHKLRTLKPGRPIIPLTFDPKDENTAKACSRKKK